MRCGPTAFFRRLKKRKNSPRISASIAFIYAQMRFFYINQNIRNDKSLQSTKFNKLPFMKMLQTIRNDSIP